jgi:S-adenosylmethionine uptake transporter
LAGAALCAPHALRIVPKAAPCIKDRALRCDESLAQARSGNAWNWPMRSSHFLPVVSVTAGIAVFSLMDATIKAASIAAGVFTALWLRSVIGTVLTLPLWLASGGPAQFRRANLRIHAVRSAVVVCMAPLFFWGLVRMPMAEGIALSFIAPLIALYLAAVLLGERIRPEAIIASLFGLAGVAVIAVAKFGGPDAAGASLPGFFAILGSAVF